VLTAFALVLARVLGLFAAAPVLGRSELPLRFKLLLCASLAGALLPAAAGAPIPVDAVAIAGALASELALGYAIGLLARLLLSAFHFAGELVAFQSGFAASQMFDVDTGQNGTVIATLHLTLATLLLLAIDGHHLLIRSLAASFQSFPLGAPLESGVLAESVLAAGADVFESGARIAAPLTGLMLLLNAAIGFLNRVMPQLSIFNVGFALTLIGGLVGLLIEIPELVFYFGVAFAGLEDRLAALVGG
jgi:flagellar biosynthetic protein FliR